MPALLADRLPSTLVSIAQLLLHRRRGLSDLNAMPRIERAVSGARISEDWLRRYQRCTGGAAWPLGCMPPLALQIVSSPLHMSVMADRAFPFRPLGIVHQSQRIQQWQVLSPSVAYDLKVYTSEASVEPRGISFGLVTEARQGKTLVWRSEVRVLSMNRTLAKGASTKRYVEPFAGLQPLINETLNVPETTGREYASIAGDYNPVHVHAWLARPFGFRRAIAHGTWTLARALSCAGVAASPGLTLDARFHRPVELPSRIRVTSYSGAAPDERWLRVTDADGTQTLLSASVTLALP